MSSWDERYKNGFYDGEDEPKELLLKFWQTIPKGNVIDIAMGIGKDAIFLADRGYNVFGIEMSIEAIKIAKQSTKNNISIICGDAGCLPFKENTAKGIIVFYFLLRDIMKDIENILQKRGTLIYETFLKKQNEIDRKRNKDFLLDDGELISHFSNFEILFYEETILTIKGKKRAIARFVGRKK